jgi:RNA polymerase sigma-70 factor, ECF subfamily
LCHARRGRIGGTRVPLGHATVSRRGVFFGVMDTDRRLVADLAHDLDAGFEALVIAHQDRIYSIALRMLGDRSAAEEAAQDAFVRAYRALAGYDEARIRELRLRPWLATIVLNLCRTRLARRAARGAPPLSFDIEASPLPEPMATDATTIPAAVIERRAERERWAALLACLPPAYRSAVVLRHVDGLSYPELATALGRPEGTVKAQVHRGLAMLRTAIESNDRLERQEMTA